MSESRTELLAWMNDLLQLGYTKVEQCGTGAAHCQIMDSIFRDVPLSKVKFAAKHEYEYIQNFKVLQSVFDKHKIDNAIPVQRLVKCKFQDNLEFLQWMKKYWDQYFPGGVYDAIGRRKGDSAISSPTKVPASRTASGPMKKSVSNPTVASVPRGTSTRSSNGNLPSAHAAKAAGHASSSAHNLNGSSSGLHRSGSAQSNWEREKADLEQEYQKIINEVRVELSETRAAQDQTEREREFYFNKLREIEVLVQTLFDNGSVTPGPFEDAMKDIQAIMYKTEEGFEIPTDADGVPIDQVEEEETF
ncbi:hypothetical protein HDU96_007879 [Phlyctochytrium bullatum]|nr:hypothetical protein HDU96_007879 [Phlyctochytrium bullatum]